MGGEPGEQGGVFNAGLAPQVHDRELARAQQSGKRLWTDAQPPLRFVEGNQLRRDGQLQGEVQLASGRAASGAEVWGQGGHGWDVTSQSRTCNAVDGDGRQPRAVLGQDWGDSITILC